MDTTFQSFLKPLSISFNHELFSITTLAKTVIREVHSYIEFVIKDPRIQQAIAKGNKLAVDITGSSEEGKKY